MMNSYKNENFQLIFYRIYIFIQIFSINWILIQFIFIDMVRCN